jgi:hypothetical protein
MPLADLFANNYFIRLLRGRTSDYDLIVSMIGVKLGDRLLQIGGGDGLLLAALGARTGLTGRVSAIETDAESAARVKDQAMKDGVLSEVDVASFAQLPFENETFDIVVIPYPGAPGATAVSSANAGGAASAGAAAAAGALPGADEAFRVLRLGGRCEVIAKAAAGASGGPGAIAAQLQQHGFKAARLIAERDGFAFYEAIKK